MRLATTKGNRAGNRRQWIGQRGRISRMLDPNQSRMRARRPNCGSTTNVEAF
jgi:hypothetical protein